MMKISSKQQSLLLLNVLTLASCRHLVIDLYDPLFVLHLDPIRHAELIAKAMRGPETWKSIFISFSGLRDDKVTEQQDKIESLCHIRTERLQIACSLLSEAIIRSCDPKVLKNVTVSHCEQHELLRMVVGHCTNLETLQVLNSSCDAGRAGYCWETLQCIGRSLPLLKELFFESDILHYLKSSIRTSLPRALLKVKLVD